LQTRVESVLGRQVSLAAIFQNPTVAEFSSALEDHGASARHVALLTTASPGDKPPLICLHSLSSAQRLAKRLDAKWPVYGVESPIDKELRLWHQHHRVEVSLEEVAERSLAIIRQIQPRGPYYLTGFCFGGTLAFEVARRLMLDGQDVALLALIDAFYLPGCNRLFLPWLRRCAYHSRKGWEEGPGYFLAKARIARARARRRREELKQISNRDGLWQGTPSEPPNLPKADFLRKLSVAFKAEPYAGNAVLLRATGETYFTLNPGPANGWDSVIQGDLQISDLACSHMATSEEPQVSHVANWLYQHLSRTFGCGMVNRGEAVRMPFSFSPAI
jgi:thioesterase domain-containing protein